MKLLFLIFSLFLCFSFLLCEFFAFVPGSKQYRIQSNSSISEGEESEEHTRKVISEVEFQEDSLDKVHSSNDSEIEKCFHCLDLHYFGHYFDKKCVPKDIDIECQPDFCPKYFDCPEAAEEILQPEDSCSFNNNFYSVDSVINSGDPCRECLCKKGSENTTEIECTQADCPGDVFEELKDNCYRKYSKNQCCPEVICGEELKNIVCEMDGTEYRYGDQFSSINDPCLTCVCDEFWNVNKTIPEQNCNKIHCVFDTKKYHQDCVPIYSSNSCCPVDYHCRKFFMQFSLVFFNFFSVISAPDENENKTEMKCKFGDKNYSIGDKILTSEDSKKDKNDKCLDCSCLVPPMITCSEIDC